MCTEATTPAVLSARYGQPTLTSFTKGNSMAVAELQPETKTTQHDNTREMVNQSLRTRMDSFTKPLYDE